MHGNMDMSFQIIFAFTCYRHESFANNTFDFNFISSLVKARKFCLKLTIKFALSLWHIPSKKKKKPHTHTHTHKNIAYLCALGKHKHRFVKNYKTTVLFMKQNLQYADINAVITWLFFCLLESVAID
jgi:hypothetical protein